MDNNIGWVYLVAGSLNQLFQGRTFVPLRTAKVSAQAAPELRAKLEFVSLNIANQYNALKLTVLNRIDGAVDINILRFGDLLGKKMVSNPNFSDGVIPHLWDDYGKVSWYVYQPEQADYKLLAGVVDEYLQIFQNQEEAQENIPQMC